MVNGPRGFLVYILELISEILYFEITVIPCMEFSGNLERPTEVGQLPILALPPYHMRTLHIRGIRTIDET